MAGDPSQASDSVSLSRTQGGITENWAFSIGQFYLKMRPGQRKAGWRKTHSRQHLCLDQATPEACTVLWPARHGFCLFCHRVLTNTNLVRAGHEGARTGLLTLGHHYEYKRCRRKEPLGLTFQICDEIITPLLPLADSGIEHLQASWLKQNTVTFLFRSQGYFEWEAREQ